ncbi:hypothetical protein D5018_04560 [Parashewanella curva]|uniref:Uncharacterized protein n=1 Tax=Parashewanella curva TaxID=2338552 RepID=A0A3L8Q238_9GAMM|nr:hypothetical protein [Parashewanella curva]RLV60918.1 hypothetical protein D5018_04560 [Parashewanella curva]
MKFAVVAFCLFLGACSSTSKQAVNSDTSMALAEQHTPKSVNGTFKLPIKSTALVGERVYLNTQNDYRDRRNISVEITPMLVFELDESYGTPPEKYFLNKLLEVKGEVKKIKIYVISDGKVTKDYYFQTLIKINSLNQINVSS